MRRRLNFRYCAFSKQILKDIEIVDVQSENSPAMHESVKGGKIVRVSLKPSLVDGLHGNIEENSVTFHFLQKYVPNN